MPIEWDEQKRRQTLATRHLDFADVAFIDWETAIFFHDERYDYGETRHVVFGLLRGRLIVVAFTIRGEALRVISMRKANLRERDVYDEAINR